MTTGIISTLSSKQVSNSITVHLNFEEHRPPYLLEDLNSALFFPRKNMHPWESVIDQNGRALAAIRRAESGRPQQCMK